MSLELKNWTMRIWVKDRRYKTGERVYGTYVYDRRHEQWMREEVRDLQAGLYPEPKYRIEVDPTTVEVRNLMTGEMVEIPFTDRGGPCDPSTELYWTM